MKRIKSIVVILVLILGIALASQVYAADDVKNLMAQPNRPFTDDNLDGTTGNDIYRFLQGNNGFNMGYGVFKIYEDTEYQTPYYCLRAGYGFGARGNLDVSENAVEYKYIGEMHNDANDILNKYAYLYNIDIEDDDSLSRANVSYNAVLWIFEQIYLPFNITKQENGENQTVYNEEEYKRELLTKAGVTDEDTQDLITKDDLEVIGQLAIWHYTNIDTSIHLENSSTITNYIGFSTYENSLYNDDYKRFENIGTIADYDNVNIRMIALNKVYNYLISGASNYNGYYGTDNERNLETKSRDFYRPSESDENYNDLRFKIKSIDDDEDPYYLIGPFKIGINENNTIPKNEIILKDNNQVVIPRKVSGMTIYEFLDSNKQSIGEGAINEGKTYYIKLYKAVATGYDLSTVSLNTEATCLNSVVKVYEAKADYEAQAAGTLQQDSEKSQIVASVYREEVPIGDTIEAELEKPFDLALRKFIVSKNGVAVTTSREPDIYVANLVNGVEVNGETQYTATYDHSKTKVDVEPGDRVVYTIRVYNEGDLAGTASEITDFLPEGLTLAPDSSINTEYQWGEVGGNKQVVKTTYLADETINPIDKTKIAKESDNEEWQPVKDDENGIYGLYYKDVQIECIVGAPGEQARNLRNVAAITGYKNEKDQDDRDSWGDDINSSNLDQYNPQGDNSTYVQDDDDYEDLKLRAGKLDLSLRKFIVSKNGEGVEPLREPTIDTSKLNTVVEGTKITTATYGKEKTELAVRTGDKIVYEIRVYNEGEVSGTATEITDYLPARLKMVDLDKSQINSDYGWQANGKIVTTPYLSSKTIKPFDGKNHTPGNGEYWQDANKGDGGFYYQKLLIECEVLPETEENVNAENPLRNIAAITAYSKPDRDSDSIININDYNPPEDNSTYQQDDDDYENLVAKEGSYDVILKKKDTRGNTITDDAVFEVKIGNEGNYKEITVAGNAKIADDVQITDTSSQDIYYIKEKTAPETYGKFQGTIKVEVNKKLDGSKYVVDSVKYYVDNVEITSENTKDDLEVTVTEEGNVQIVVEDAQFDLALRKYISKVKTGELETKYDDEENASSICRKVDPKTENLNKNGVTTAEYRHRKDPVKVEEGSTVTYKIVVYNEGDIDGRATEIIDKLPAGLKFTRVVSGIYESDGTYTEENRTLVLVRKAGEDGNIPAYNEEGIILSNEIEIECEVTAKPDTDNDIILTNIAWIAESTNELDATLQDRDSISGNTTVPEDKNLPGYIGKDTNNEKDATSKDSYFEGQDDDDDFEKVVIKPIKGLYNVVLVKKDARGNTITDAAVFDVKIGDEGNYESKTTAQGKIDIAENVTISSTGLGTPDIYYIKETQAPNKYAKFQGTIKVEVPKKYEIVNEIPKYVIDGEKIKCYVNNELIDGETDDLNVELRNGILYIEVADRQFDLALRKYITKVERKEGNTFTNVEISNARNLDNIYITGLKNGSKDTAEYKNRKDPIEVEPEDLVTYTFKTFNEGEIKGYVYSITDYIPNGLEFKEEYNNGFVSQSDVQNYNTNVYNKDENELTAEQRALKTKVEGAQFVYEWDATKRSLTINNADYAKLPAMDGPMDTLWSLDTFNGETLDSQGLSIRLEVTANTTNKDQVLTNIATMNYGSKGGTTSDEPVLDRDSSGEIFKDTIAEPSISDLKEGYIGKDTNNSKDATSQDSYFEGQQDDDDFEKVVIKGKNFDLSLRKYVEKVNGENTETSGVPAIDTSKLKTGEETTAKYVHSKEPLVVKQGDLVTYKIRIYNEGQRDGYANTVTDYLPDGLGFIYIDTTEVGKSAWILPTDTEIESKSLYGENGIYSSEEKVLKKDAYKKVFGEDVDLANVHVVQGKLNEDGTRNMLKITAGGTIGESEIKATDLIKAYGSTRENNDLWQQSTNDENDGLFYQELEITCIVLKENTYMGTLKNVAEITSAEDSQGIEIINPTDDRDSEVNNVYEDSKHEPGEEVDGYTPGEQDDDDFQPIVLKYFDLALRKFITKVESNGNAQEITERIPQAKRDENGKIKYDTKKTAVDVANGDIVTYTIRVYNEGTLAGYAEEITDDIPSGLEYLPKNDTNKEYGWVMINKDGNPTEDVKEAVKVTTDYLSKAKNETDNLLNPFDASKEISMEDPCNPDYKDVKIAFRIAEPDTSDRIIVNSAQISKDSNDDEDSVPDEWRPEDDDQDQEFVKVKYFDLSLLKWITKTIVIDNDKTVETETGFKPNTGKTQTTGIRDNSSAEPIAKVEIYRKNMESTTVKLVYQIRVTNEGEIEGYATEITDFIPEGLEFYKEDNSEFGWSEEETGKVVTRALEGKLLKPGESAEVTIVFRWNNNADSLGLKTNIAEITEDYNVYGSEDIDSDPGNIKKPYEQEQQDDDDFALAIISVETGRGAEYTVLILAMVILLASGIYLIKRYVLA